MEDPWLKHWHFPLTIRFSCNKLLIICVVSISILFYTYIHIFLYVCYFPCILLWSITLISWLFSRLIAIALVIDLRVKQQSAPILGQTNEMTEWTVPIDSLWNLLRLPWLIKSRKRIETKATKWWHTPSVVYLWPDIVPNTILALPLSPSLASEIP